MSLSNVSAICRLSLTNLLHCREEGKWSSEGGASFGFSFALVVIAAGIYLLDIAIIYIATRDPHRNKKVREFSCTRTLCVRRDSLVT